MQNIKCPKCNSAELLFSKKKQRYICEDCEHTFTVHEPFVPKRLFISYGHDHHAAFAERLKGDLESRGYEVWFDRDRIKPGGDWENYIHEGLEWVSMDPGQGRLLLLMTPHSLRRPDGYCLNEVAMALARNIQIIPVMLEWVEPLLSIYLEYCLPTSMQLPIRQ